MRGNLEVVHRMCLYIIAVEVFSLCTFRLKGLDDYL